jgi:hypothetical protein
MEISKSRKVVSLMYDFEGWYINLDNNPNKDNAMKQRRNDKELPKDPKTALLQERSRVCYWAC